LNIGSEGVFDRSRTHESISVQECNLYEGGRIIDPHKTVDWTNGINLVRRGTGSRDLELGEHINIDPGAIA
jgi:hypothetical protein